LHCSGTPNQSSPSDYWRGFSLFIRPRSTGLTVTINRRKAPKEE
jgi:hypothetical protein